MYEPESVTEIKDNNENNNECILLGYKKIPEEKDNEYDIEEEEDDDDNDIINYNTNINDEITIKEKINE